MAYLIHLNNKLKRQYEEIEKVLLNIRNDLDLQHIKFPLGINRDFVVTDNAIKRLESFLMALEDYFEIKKTVISKTYAPKRNKLEALQKRARELAKISQKVNEEVTN
ncbi:hypothetical protein [Flexithrix dorotheae]|uniref:hypothetical protein n=1 Tax=Flexithrix dorotheae TaxID=70993 RepID=UPI000360E882|nr:hypothetical protein [Flexithrix dorotheae]